jgi:hypothetical protein
MPASRIVAVSLTTLLLAIAVPATAQAVRSFQSPSHNIGCTFAAGQARCDIASHTWTVPKPKSCELDYGGGLFVTKKGTRAKVVCAGDTVLHQGKVLPYGKSIARDGIRCISRTTGVTCRNSRNHGFRISRQSYKLF